MTYLEDKAMLRVIKDIESRGCRLLTGRAGRRRDASLGAVTEAFVQKRLGYHVPSLEHRDNQRTRLLTPPPLLTVNFVMHAIASASPLT